MPFLTVYVFFAPEKCVKNSKILWLLIPLKIICKSIKILSHCMESTIYNVELQLKLYAIKK